MSIQTCTLAAGSESAAAWVDFNPLQAALKAILARVRPLDAGESSATARAKRLSRSIACKLLNTWLPLNRSRALPKRQGDITKYGTCLQARGMLEAFFFPVSGSKSAIRQVHLHGALTKVCLFSEPSCHSVRPARLESFAECPLLRFARRGATTRQPWSTSDPRGSNQRPRG
jgi:hypothetical protein